MYICNNNNCWFTNVGEAFIDVGVSAFVKKIMSRIQNVQYGCISPMTNYYLPQNEKNYSAIHLSDFFRPDLLILPGMYATEEFCNSMDVAKQLDYVRKMKSNGTRVGFLGVGAKTYNDAEKQVIVRTFSELEPLFVVTRDKKTYDMLSDYVECKQGIDCAFWINDAFDPRGMKHEVYSVSTFNRSDEPVEIASYGGMIHPWHMQYSFDESRTRFLSKDNLFLSDSPYEYLTLYANAHKVYTDLVHATIPCLLYGVPVKYWKIDERSDAFLSLNYLYEDKEGFLFLDKKKLSIAKDDIEKYVISKVWKDMKI